MPPWLVIPYDLSTLYREHTISPVAKGLIAAYIWHNPSLNLNSPKYAIFALSARSLDSNMYAIQPIVMIHSPRPLYTD